MPDGSIRWLQWTHRAIFDKYDSTIDYQSVGRDITDRKAAEESLIYLSPVSYTHLDVYKRQPILALNASDQAVNGVSIKVGILSSM